MREVMSGAEGIRTPDTYTASVVLSQLSYSPEKYEPNDSEQWS